ncbi:MAG: TRAP transporter small permease subunit [Rhodobacteraceae bacterium]|nr:TRAP transporter small permease subunit [Paracoccaceae bacterium]
MALLTGLLWPLEKLNVFLLAIGRVLALAALMIMVAFICYQIFMRLFFDAPNWTEEGARFLMLWMTGLIAPLAYRQGGFVAIDMLERALPRVLAAVLTLVLLVCGLLVIWTCATLGWDNVNSFTGRGTSASLRLPLDWFGGERIKFKNSWAFSSLFVGFCLLLLVNIELILRQVITLFGGGDYLKPLEDAGPID